MSNSLAEAAAAAGADAGAEAGAGWVAGRPHTDPALADYLTALQRNSSAGTYPPRGRRRPIEYEDLTRPAQR